MDEIRCHFCQQPVAESVPVIRNARVCPDPHCQVLLRASLAVLPSRFVPHLPFEQQLLFLLLPEGEALYGGAAGGGKTDALLMGALQWVEEPKYSAIIFRRTWPELKQSGGLIERSQEWLQGTPATWNATDKRWHFPSGATLSFAYMEREEDRFRYSGATFQFVGFDEMTGFTAKQVRFMHSRLRRLRGSRVVPKLRGASNPGGPGHEWVKKRYVDPRSASFPFVRSMAKDNIFLDLDDYLPRLENLDPVTRAQLLGGDWSAREAGSMFHREWFRIIDAVPHTANSWTRVWDLAATDNPTSFKVKRAETAGILMARFHLGWLIRHCDAFMLKSGARDNRIVQRAAMDPVGTHIHIEQEPGSGGKAQIEALQRMLVGYRCSPVLPQGEKETRAGPMATQAQLGNIYLLNGPWVEAFLDAAEGFPVSGKDKIDAAAHAFNLLARPGSGTPAAPEARKSALPWEDAVPRRPS